MRSQELRSSWYLSYKYHFNHTDDFWKMPWQQTTYECVIWKRRYFSLVSHFILNSVSTTYFTHAYNSFIYILSYLYIMIDWFVFWLSRTSNQVEESDFFCQTWLCKAAFCHQMEARRLLLTENPLTKWCSTPPAFNKCSVIVRRSMPE